MPKVLSQDVIINFKDYGDIKIPKGTATTHKTATGIDERYNFVNDFGWIDRDYNKISRMLKHDATYYGIIIPAEFIEDTNNKSINHAI